MAKTTGDVIVEGLIAWGVDTVFGLPGDGINGVFESLRKNREKIRFVQVRHEEAAAFAACGYAKFSGRLGVCVVTSGPGAIHLLNGLYDAKLDGAPVLAITGHTYHDLIGTRYQQEVDLPALFKDVASHHNTLVGGPIHARNVIDVACRTALSLKTVAHLTIPADVQEMTLSEDEASPMNVPGHTSHAWRPPVVVPEAEALKSAAAVLNAGKKTVVLAGQGALGCADELEALAERMASPVIKPLLGKACVPDDSPYTTGGIGLLGTLPSEDAMQACDSLFVVGASFPYLPWYPKPGQARAVQLDVDPTRLGLRYPIEIGLTGDAKATLRALLPLIERREDRSFLETAQAGMAKWRELMRERASRDDVPTKPQVVAAAVNDLLAPDAVVAVDSGTITSWAARHIQMKRGMQFSCSGNLASMANALPYALGAQAAFPGRQVVAFVGDGGFSMLMAEMATAVKHKLPIKVVVIKNNTLGQIKWEQMVFLGNPEYEVALQPIDFVKVAEACGAVGFRSETPGDLHAALRAAFDAPGPALVEAVVDELEPPMPARATPAQALHFAQSLARGEPDAGKILATVFKNQWRELV